MLLGFDQDLFFFINHDMSNGVLDSIALFLRNRFTWIPLYVLAGVVIAVKWRWQGVAIILMAALTAVLTDYTSSGIIKPMVERLRPCNDPTVPAQVNLLLDKCGAGYSFPSSHAANHFGLALFFSWLWGRRFRWLSPVLITWALLIGVSQIYVGVHYPFDIFGGAVVGAAISLLTWLLLKRIILPRIRHDIS